MTEVSAKVRELDVDRLRELTNIGAGHAATAFARLVGRPCRMRVPTVRVLTADSAAIPFVASVRDDERRGMTGIFFEIEGVRETLYAAIQAYAAENGGPIAYSSAAYPYFFNDSNADGTAGEDEANTGNVIRLRHIDRLDAGMGDRTAEDLHVEHAGQNDVVDIVALAADEPVVLHTTSVRSEPTDLDLVECHQASSPVPALERSSSAAHRTAFTMFW